MPWSLREHQREPDRLGHLLYWQRLMPGGDGDVVWQNDHSLLSVVRYRGPDMESADAHELMALRARVHQVLLTLDAGWTLHFEERKHEAAAYPPCDWEHPVAGLIDEERRAQVGTPGTHFETSYHLTLTRHIPWTVGRWWTNLWWENIPEGHAEIDDITSFRDEVTRLRRQLAGVFAESTVLTGDALATYLSSTVSQWTQPLVAMPSSPYFLNYQLCDTDLVAGATPKLGRLWLRPIVVKGEKQRPAFPETTYPGILDVLHDLGLAYRYVLRWIPLAHAKAKRELNLLENAYRGQHKSVGTQLMERATGKPSAKTSQAADHHAEEISEALAVLDEGVAKWGYITMTVLVWDEDFAVAEQKREAVEQALRARGFLASVEHIDAVGAYLGTIPGDSYHNVEKPMLTSLNALDLAPLTSVWAGPTWVPHLKGPPLLVATARGQTPFRVTTHEGDVGDFFMLGPKGAGKSLNLALMSAGWMRYDGAKLRALDKGSSLKALTMAMDGNWMLLAPGSTRPLQPLARIDDGVECSWALGWIADRLEEAHVPVTPAVQAEVWASLEALATFAPRHRTMSGLVGLLQSEVLRQALALYTVGGPFEFLDGDEDWMYLSHWDCFEMEPLLDDFPRLVPAVFSLLARRIEGALDGSPTLINIEECHAFFQLPGPSKRQLGWLKTFRRRNGTLGFYTQNPLDIANNPVGDELVQACPTRFFLPNPHALEPRVMAIYESFGLSRRQCELIALGVPKRDVYYVGQQGTRQYQVDAGPITVSYCGRSRQVDLAKIAAVDEARTEPFGIAWLRAEGHETAANLLGEAYAPDKDLATDDWDAAVPDGPVVGATE
jgi:type IV secretion system protein TrbE